MSTVCLPVFVGRFHENNLHRDKMVEMAVRSAADRRVMVDTTATRRDNQGSFQLSAPGLIDTPFQRLQATLWSYKPKSHASRLGLRIARYAFALLRDFFAGELSLRAMSLVYTSLLSLVPLLALAFSLLKAFGIHNALEKVLDQFLAPLGPDGANLSRQILGFVDNMKVGVLGSVGVALLVYTAISLIHKIETSFNFAWEIEQGRALSRRFGDYLSVLLVGPLLVFSALGLTASIKSSHVVLSLMQLDAFGPILVLAFKLIPYALICGTFSFLYIYIPNIRVKARAALGAGLFAGIVWQAASAAFATFVANSGGYNAVYSGFAIVIFLLLWLYVGWLILLLGCKLAFYLQYPARLRPHVPLTEASIHEREALGMAALALITERYANGHPALSTVQIADQMGVSVRRAQSALAPLFKSGLLAIAEESEGVLPARDPSSVTVGQAWRAMRWSDGDKSAQEVQHKGVDLVTRIESEAENQQGLSLRDWSRNETEAVVATGGKPGTRSD